MSTTPNNFMSVLLFYFKRNIDIYPRGRRYWSEAPFHWNFWRRVGWNESKAWCWSIREKKPI